jgi:hypothetical protein
MRLEYGWFFILIMENVEIWKDIKGYENLYKINILGEVKSYDRYVNGKLGSKIFKRGIFNKIFLNNKGYKCVRLSKNNTNIEFKIHSLLMMVFVRERMENEVINHKNGIKTDNALKNLEYITQRENISHHQLNRTGKSSKYIGVCYNSKRNKYESYIEFNNKKKFLGFFNSELDAKIKRITFEKENNIINVYTNQELENNPELSKKYQLSKLHQGKKI